MRRLSFLAIALLLLGAAACTQPKPNIPTPTLVPLNQTPVLPLSATETPAAPSAAGTPAQGVPSDTPSIEVGPTLLPTPTSAFPTAAPPPGSEATPAPTAEGGNTNAGGTTASACPSPYTVQRGDWLYQIARKCGITPQALIAANPGVNPNFVFPGQVLRIPGGSTAPSGGGNIPPTTSGRTYVVRHGDTLFSIAIRFGVTVFAIMQANGISNPNFIFPGQVLRIP